ncbi:MAG: AAA family ATPase [Bacteroidota bacterium]
MYLQRVKITNIRSIGNLEFQFPKPAGWHVLIGDNGAGKSTILRSIALAILGPREALSLRLPWNQYIAKGQGEGTIELRVQRQDYDRYTGKARSLKRPFDAGVKIALEKDNGHNITGNISSFKQYRHADNYIWSGSAGWFSTSFGPFRRFTGGNKDWGKVYYSNPRAGAHLSVFGEDVALTESLEWLRELNYQKLEGNEKSQRELDCLIKFINEGELLPHGASISGVSSNGVQLHDGNGREIDITEMSDGFRSILSLTFELLRQMVLVYGSEEVFKNIEASDLRIDLPGVVLIDEVDAHLHPTWQARVGQWFTKYFPALQFIVTTHSPIICRAADQGSIWRLAAPGGGNESYKVEGDERKRLIYGNILDAFSTGLFGHNITSSEAAIEMLEKLAHLNKKSVRGTISNSENIERQSLIAIFPTDSFEL